MPKAHECNIATALSENLLMFSLGARLFSLCFKDTELNPWTCALNPSSCVFGEEESN